MKPVEIVGIPHPQMTVTSPRSCKLAHSSKFALTFTLAISTPKPSMEVPSCPWAETESSLNDFTITHIRVCIKSISPIPQIPSSPLASSLGIPENIPHYSPYTHNVNRAIFDSRPLGHDHIWFHYSRCPLPTQPDFPVHLSSKWSRQLCVRVKCGRPLCYLDHRKRSSQ